MQTKIKDMVVKGVDKRIRAQLRTLKWFLVVVLVAGGCIAVLTALLVLVTWLLVRQNQRQREVVVSDVRSTTPMPPAPPSPPTPSTPPTPKPAPKPAVGPVAGQVDDLRKVKGIGPKTAGVLQAAGISTFAVLAGTSVAELRAILDAAGVSKVVKPDSWPEQARALVGG